MSAETLTWKQLQRKLRHMKPVQILLLSVLVVLLPIVVGLLLWSRMPEQITVFIDSDLRPDGRIGLPFAVFLPPLVLLFAQVIIFFLINQKYEDEDQTLTVFHLGLWILPVMSNLISYMTYALAMGTQYSLSSYVQLVLGLVLAFIGNHMPRIKPNAAIGIRIPWAFTSRHNWRFTHRYSGYVWMIGGLLLILSAFLPGRFGMEITRGVLLALMLIPVGLSYGYYLRQKLRGEPVHHVPKPGKGVFLALAALVILAAVLTFTGNLDFTFYRDHLQIKASYYDDFSVNYQDIQSVEYCGGDVEGNRIGGFSNLRLQMGFFHDPETENTYTRYAYARPEACVILTLHDRQLVISGKNQTETQKLYEQLLERTEN